MKKSSIEFSVGVFILLGLACVAYLNIKLGKMELIGDHYYSLSAKFNSAAGLKRGSDVEIAGVKIGQVESISLDPVMKIAQVKMKIEKGIQLEEDAIASIKTSGLIGDKFIAITPGGSSEMIAPGGTITETEPALDIEDLVSKYVFGDKKEKKE